MWYPMRNAVAVSSILTPGLHGPVSSVVERRTFMWRDAVAVSSILTPGLHGLVSSVGRAPHSYVHFLILRKFFFFLDPDLFC